MGMVDVLRIDKILDFCDVPQLFVARDAFDTLYLCLVGDALILTAVGLEADASVEKHFQIVPHVVD